MDSRHSFSSRMSQAKVMEEKWEKKLDLRCEDVFAQAVIKCRSPCSSTLATLIFFKDPPVAGSAAVLGKGGGGVITHVIRLKRMTN